ncbi:MAG: GNAT family N-acetyltransferase, partial [Planctomycetaceae bacterium]|nr:GNAT family N-acetyltransferase [Planctomycetaceae bacterium]
IRSAWDALLTKTPAASFFQSLRWLEIYWRHFAPGQRLRVLVVEDNGEPIGIVPLVVRRESSKVGPLRILTFPLHAWGSFYGPIGPDAIATLHAGLDHVRQSRTDWDVLELRWQGAPGTDYQDTRQAMLDAGLQAYATVWERTAVVDFDGTWDAYWASRKGAWLRRFRHAERKLAERGKLDYVRYRPQASQDDSTPRWDLYDACEQLARRSWQGSATDGTTLSHESIRGFLREVHQAAARAGAVDLNLLYLNGEPVAFMYGYYYNGYIYGLRRGYDAELASDGAGNVLMAYALQDSFARGDRMYDLGVGSLESKRHFQTRLVPIWRLSHFARRTPRAQLLRLARWWQARNVSARID